MKVFLSWSGERSRAIAEALREWIPNVIQAVQPWMSAEDIDKGLRWSSEVAIELEETRFGIICLTPENLEAPWILFEAGALSKLLDKSFVCPFLSGLEPTDVKGPLIQFQATKAGKADVKKLIQTLNRALGDSALSMEKLERAFDHWWPDLESSFQNLPDVLNEPRLQRTDREMLQEILEILRAEARDRKVLSLAYETYRIPADSEVERVVQRINPTSDLTAEDRIKAALEAKGKMRIVAALDRGRVSIEGDYLRVDYAPEDSRCKTEIEDRNRRIAIEDACEQVLGRRLTLRALIGP